MTAILRILGLSQEKHFQTYHRELLMALLTAFVPNGPVVLGLDDTIERRRRAIPIALMRVGHVRGHNSGTTQLELLTDARSLLPKGFVVLLVGDSEFRPVEVLKQLDQWGWEYVLRQKSSVHVYLSQETEWHDLGSWVKQPGQRRW